MPFDITDLIYHRPQFIPEDQCQYLIDHWLQRQQQAVVEHCPHAATGIDTYSTFEKVVLEPGTPAFDIVHSATERMVQDYMDFLDGFGMFHARIRDSMRWAHQYRLLRYDQGQSIHPHIDHDPFVYGSCTFNLNTGYQGGDFVWFRGRHRISLGLGDALIFPADYFWVHEVEEVTQGQRYSTNCFLLSVSDSVRLATDAYKNWLLEGYRLNVPQCRHQHPDLQWQYNIPRSYIDDQPAPN